MQAYNSITNGFIFIGFIYFMLKGKSSAEFTNLRSPKKNE